MDESVLLSIRPEFAERIIRGTKKYEFRKNTFKREGIRRIYIYATSPIKKIIGYFEIETILEGSPREIWKICSKSAGIGKRDFFSYYRGKDRAYSIKVGNVRAFSPPICPYSRLENFHPPQSYMYIKDGYILEGERTPSMDKSSVQETARVPFLVRE